MRNEQFYCQGEGGEFLIHITGTGSKVEEKKMYQMTIYPMPPKVLYLQGAHNGRFVGKGHLNDPNTILLSNFGPPLVLKVRYFFESQIFLKFKSV